MTRIRFVAAASLALSLVSVPVVAAAQTEVVVSPADASEASARRFPRDLAFSGGLRMLFANDRGLGPYMDGGAIPELATGVSAPLLRAGRFSLAAAVEWDLGGRSATARGDASSLMANRFAGGFEGRFSLATRLYAFARVMPSALRVDATIDDAAAAGRSLGAGGWTWGLDTSGGAALMIAGNRHSRLHLWMIAEAGYAFCGPVKMRLSPSEEVDDPRTFGTVALPDARLQGAVGSLALALAM